MGPGIEGPSNLIRPRVHPMRTEIATADMKIHSKVKDAVTLSLYAVGISAGAVVGLMGLLLAA